MNNSSSYLRRPFQNVEADIAGYSMEIIIAGFGMMLNLAHLFELNLISLCIADFTSSPCFIAFWIHGIYGLSMAVKIGQLYFHNYKVGWFEKISPVLLRISLVLSFTHILFIAFQRLIASLYPLKFRLLFTRGKCISFILFLW